MDDTQQNPIVTPDENTTEPKVLPTPLKPVGIHTTQHELSTQSGKHVDKSEGAQPGNTNRMKWKTAEERMKACEAICIELKQGFPKEYLDTADWDTILRYMRDFPVDFPSDAIEHAVRQGKKRIISIGYSGMVGKLEGFSARTWEFVTQNMTGWKLRHDTTTNDKDLPTPILGGKTNENE